MAAPISRRCWPLEDELLAAIDVVGRARESSITHDINRKSSHIGRVDHATDGEPGAQFVTRPMTTTVWPESAGVLLISVVV
jgi:hypothetical protein